MTILETNRLILREFVENDLDDLIPIMANQEVMRFSLSGPLKKEQVKELLHKRLLSHYVEYGFGLYAVIFKEDKKLIGGIGLLTQNLDGADKVELAYRLDTNYWGKGLATEAAQAICRYAFDQLQLKELISIIDPKNIRSIEVAKRVGMHYWKDAFFHGIPVCVYVLWPGMRRN